MAQEGAGRSSIGGSTASPGSGSNPGGGASSSFGTPSTPEKVPGALDPFGDEAAYGTKPAAPGASTTTPGTKPDATTPGGAASSFGGGSGYTPTTRTAPASFVVPGLYGRGAQQFTAGEGRLARPRFSFSGSLSLGYDDNVLQTPTNPAIVRGQKQQVLISLGSPETSREVIVPSGDPAVPDTVVIVTDPAVLPKLKTQTIPVPPPAQRIGSFVTRANAKFDTQFASRRSLFTFDLGGGVDYYWHRPDKKTEPNANVSLIYLRRLTGRAQFTVAWTLPTGATKLFPAQHPDD